MKINNSLAEALLMLSLIILVLVATSDFANQMYKTVSMSCLGLLAVLMGIFRVIGGRQEKKDE